MQTHAKVLQYVEICVVCSALTETTNVSCTDDIFFCKILVGEASGCFRCLPEEGEMEFPVSIPEILR